MKNNLFALFLFSLLAFELCAQSNLVKPGFLSFDGKDIVHTKTFRPVARMAWYSDNDNARIDNRVLFDNHSSLFIPSVSDQPTNTYFHFWNRDIVGRKIVFTGKYKYEQARDAKLRFMITLKTFKRTMPQESTSVICNGDQGWKDFSVGMPFDRTSDFFFAIDCRGDAKLWISECQVLVDGYSFDVMVNPTVNADKDVEFNAGSKIMNINTDKQTLENLEVLGKVWGFLKYYHPDVAVGKYNWDFELFRILPRIAKARNQGERNRLLTEWVDQYGGIKEMADYTLADSANYHRFANLNWLEDVNMLGGKLSGKLLKIKNAKRNGVLNYYLPPLSGKEEVEFTREKLYREIGWEDLGYRILTVYKLWNAIEYSYPYVNHTNHSWSSLLAKYLPEFIAASSKDHLNNAIQRLATEINDSHGNLDSPEINPRLRGLPMDITQTDDGKMVVSSTWLGEIQRGSVILGVNGKPISRIIEEQCSILPSSNERGARRNTAAHMFLTPEKEIEVEVSYQGNTEIKRVPTQVMTMPYAIERKKPEEYNLGGKGIVYIDMGCISEEELERLMTTTAPNAKGLILDLRKYPSSPSLKDILGKYIHSKRTRYVWFSMNSKAYPGNFFLDILGDVGEDNSVGFKGKIAILVSESTQSEGELTSIACRTAPNSAVIGTQTAGANGHIGYFYLPRGIKFNYTIAGVFYPEWEIHQRVGVKIDIPVKQSVKDIETGEDMWIKKAIDYIGGGQ